MRGIDNENFKILQGKIAFFIESLNENSIELKSIISDLRDCYEGKNLNFLFENLCNSAGNINMIYETIANYSKTLSDVKKAYQLQDSNIASNINSIIQNVNDREV